MISFPISAQFIVNSVPNFIVSELFFSFHSPLRGRDNNPSSLLPLDKGRTGGVTFRQGDDEKKVKLTML